MGKSIEAIVVAGPTAAGKTAYAINKARETGAEIISADSMQIYRKLDIGTAKPSPEELALVPQHLIGIADPFKPFTVVDYRNAAEEAIKSIASRGKKIIICGGTGLYIDALIYDMDFSGGGEYPQLREKYYKLAEKEGNEAVHRVLWELDPVSASEIHPNNLKRVIRAIERLKSGGEGGTLREYSESRKEEGLISPEFHIISKPRDELVASINARVDKMIDSGLEDEVRGLVSLGIDQNLQSMQGIGYKEFFPYFAGEYDLDECIELIKIHTRQYAKRQNTWFRRYRKIAK